MVFSLPQREEHILGAPGGAPRQWLKERRGGILESGEAAGSTGLLDTRITEGTSTLVKALASEYSTDTNFREVIKIEKKTQKNLGVYI